MRPANQARIVGREAVIVLRKGAIELTEKTNTRPPAGEYELRMFGATASYTVTLRRIGET